MKEMARALSEIIKGSDNIVFFGGAGVSTASGIPDFRSADGLYSQQWDYPPETMVSGHFLQSHPEEFFRFYREKLMPLEAEPNAAHQLLARLEGMGKLRAVITQNVDGLHQKAGARRVLELHGSMHRNYCVRCKRTYAAQYVKGAEGIPLCECGGLVRPDVVLYGEHLDDRVVEQSLDAIRQARVLIIGGTSLTVYPAAGFVREFAGEKLVIVNKSPTPQDSAADLLLDCDIARLFDLVDLK